MFRRNAYLVWKWKPTEGAFTKCANDSIKTEILASKGKGHCELALTLYLCDLICFTLFKLHRISWQMGFGKGWRGWGEIELALLGKVHISKQNTLISPILFLQTMPPPHGPRLRMGWRLEGESYWPPKRCFNSLQNPSSQTSHRVAKFFRNVKMNMKVGRSNRSRTLELREQAEEQQLGKQSSSLCVWLCQHANMHTQQTLTPKSCQSSTVFYIPTSNREKRDTNGIKEQHKSH